MRVFWSMQNLDWVTTPDLIEVPYTGTTNTYTDLQNFYTDSSTLQLLWSFWNIAKATTSTVTYGDPNGFNIGYTAYNPGSYSSPWGNGISQIQIVKPYTNDQNHTDNSCTNSAYYYSNDQISGKISGYLKTSTYCQTHRPWYLPTFGVNHNKIVFYGPIYSSTTGVMIYTAAKTYLNNANVNHTIQTTIAISNLQTLLKSTVDSSIYVGYVMTTTTNVLLAANVDNTINTKCVGANGNNQFNLGNVTYCRGVDSPNYFVKASAMFLTKHMITTDSTHYDPSTGYTYTYKFWNYGNAKAGTTPNVYGTYNKYYVSQDVGTLNWIIVSVASPTLSKVNVSSTVTSTSTSTSTSTTSTSTSTDYEKQIDAILGLVATTFLAVLGILAISIVGLKKTSQPMSSSSVEFNKK